MPYKFRVIKKNCENCNKLLVLNNTRDITRKNFCSLSCRQLGRYKRGEFIWLKQMQIKASLPENNAKKSPGKGVNHPRWIKDRSLVKRQRTMTELREWREAIFKRDDYTCQICKIRGYQLNADHIKSYALFPELRKELSNGRTLCIDCHKATPTYAKRSEYQKELYVTV